MTADVSDGLPQPRRFWAMAGITIAIILAVLDQSISNIALPVIARDLGVERSDVVWVVIAYQLTIAVLLLPLAVLGDRFGYNRLYAGGISLFAVAALICALSPSLLVLCLARVVQGMGASAVMAVNLALVRFILPKSMLGRGVAYITLVVALSATAGPMIGSIILSIASWPWLFLAYLPLASFAALLCLKALPNTPRTRRPLDLVGIALNAAAIGGFILIIGRLGNGQNGTVLAVEFLVVFALLGVFIRQQMKQGSSLLPLDLLRIPSIGLPGLAAMLSYVVQGLCFASLPFFFHDTLQMPLLEVGWVIMLWPVGVAVGSVIAGRVIDRIGTGWLATGGFVLLAAGLLTSLFIAARIPFADIAWRVGLCGLGFGLFQVANSFAITAGAPMSRSGGASVIQAAARVFGQTIGAAAVAAIFALHPGEATLLPVAVALGVAVTAGCISAVRVVGPSTASHRS